MRTRSADTSRMRASRVVATRADRRRRPARPAALRFAVIPKALDIPVFNYAKIGAERKAKELGNVDDPVERARPAPTS